MDLFDAIRDRRSIRSYEDTLPSVEVLSRILEAAREAPSANNLMPWRFVVITDPTKRATIASSGTYGKFLARCPVVVIGVGDATASPNWYAVDTAIALEHIVLAATAEGLGTCWVGSYDEATVVKVAGIPAGHRVVALLGLGYPKRGIDFVRLASALIHPQKGLDRVASSESFDSPWKAT